MWRITRYPGSRGSFTRKLDISRIYCRFVYVSRNRVEYVSDQLGCKVGEGVGRKLQVIFFRVKVSTDVVFSFKHCNWHCFLTFTWFIYQNKIGSVINCAIFVTLERNDTMNSTWSYFSISVLTFMNESASLVNLCLGAATPCIRILNKNYLTTFFLARSFLH